MWKGKSRGPSYSKEKDWEEEMEKKQEKKIFYFFPLYCHSPCQISAYKQTKNTQRHLKFVNYQQSVDIQRQQLIFFLHLNTD